MPLHSDYDKKDKSREEAEEAARRFSGGAGSVNGGSMSSAVAEAAKEVSAAAEANKSRSAVPANLPQQQPETASANR